MHAAASYDLLIAGSYKPDSTDMGITEPDLLEAARKLQDLEAELKKNPGICTHMPFFLVYAPRSV